MSHSLSWFYCHCRKSHKLSQKTNRDNKYFKDNIWQNMCVWQTLTQGLLVALCSWKLRTLGSDLFVKLSRSRWSNVSQKISSSFCDCSYEWTITLESKALASLRENAAIIAKQDPGCETKEYSFVNINIVLCAGFIFTSWCTVKPMKGGGQPLRLLLHLNQSLQTDGGHLWRWKVTMVTTWSTQSFL